MYVIKQLFALMRLSLESSLVVLTKSLFQHLYLMVHISPKVQVGKEAIKEITFEE
jgi:hypothetical protein